VRVLVTRPAIQAAQWVEQLAARGVDAAALPLIDIGSAADPSALTQAWAALPSQTLTVFVSPNAVRQFFAHRPPATEWPPQTWAGSTGPGTSRELVAQGVPAARIVEPAGDAPQMDSEALWARLEARDWAGASVLFVRGETGRDWLADVLVRRGARVAGVAAYRRTAPEFDGTRQVLARAALAEPARHAWLFSSSEAIGNLSRTVAWAAPQDWARSWAIVTHPRIAERAALAGFGRISSVRPLLDDVVACIQSTEL
jgi:uroporphyrinogen-III synthase